MNIIISSISNFISTNFLWLELISFVICSFFLARIIFYRWEIFKMVKPIDDYLDYSGWGIKFLKKRSNKAWAQIVNRINEGSQNNLKLAIVEADNILDILFKNAGYRGKDLDERLKNTELAQVPNIDDIREAHGFRNKIFSDPNFTVSREDTLRLVNAYKTFFEYLGFLS